MSAMDEPIKAKAAERPGIAMTTVSREMLAEFSDQAIRARARVLAARGQIRLERDDAGLIRLWPVTPEATE